MNKGGNHSSNYHHHHRQYHPSQLIEDDEAGITEPPPLPKHTISLAGFSSSSSRAAAGDDKPKGRGPGPDERVTKRPPIGTTMDISNSSSSSHSFVAERSLQGHVEEVPTALVTDTCDNLEDRAINDGSPHVNFELQGRDGPNRTETNDENSIHPRHEDQEEGLDEVPTTRTEEPPSLGGGDETQEAPSSASLSDGAEMTTNTPLEANDDIEATQQVLSPSEEGNSDTEVPQPPASTNMPPPEESSMQSQTQPPRLQQPPLNYHQRDDPSQELPLAVPVPEPPAISSHHHHDRNHPSGGAVFHHTHSQGATASAGSSHMTGLPHELAVTGGQEESPGDVVQAQPLDDWKDDKDRPCLLSPTQWAIGGLLLVVLIVVGVVAGVTQASSGGGDSNDSANNLDGNNSTSAGDVETLAPTTASTDASSNNTNSTLENLGPTDPVYPPFANNLHFLTATALENPSSPQAWANTWMMEDPNLESYSEQRKLQRFSLATLYYSTGGDNWAHNNLWLDYDQDECFWYNQYAIDTTTTVAADAVSGTGVSETCDENSQILHLNLANNDLNGVLPVELFFFPALASLDLSYNGLYGTAPTMFAGARLLQRLVLSANALTGQFTAELGFVASELRILHNDGNQFTGAVPGLLRLLPNLVDLNITGNQYTGSLPPSLSQLSDTLTSFEVADNQITGSIPSQVGLATRLRVFDVGENPDLRGSIPTEIGALADLTILDIDNTGIVGVMPDQVCVLEQSGQLDLHADCDVSIDCCL